MILDKFLEFSKDQALLGVDAASTNIADLGAAGDAIPELYLIVKVTNTADFASGTSIKFDLQSDSADSFDSGAASAVEETLLTKTVLTAGLTANTEIFKTRVPLGQAKRYMRMYYDVTGTFDAGAIDAYLVMNVDHDNKVVSL